VAIGVTLAAVVMLNFFLPPLLRSDALRRPHLNASTLQGSFRPNASVVWTVTTLALVGVTAVLSHGLPALDHTATPLRPRHRAAAQSHGFTGNALAVTENILDVWQRIASTTGVFWPTNQVSRWILEKLVARTPTNFYALGLIYPVTNPMVGSDPQSAFRMPDAD